ncbi:hypothetical protein IQ07DRAFT_585635 [Pyrenochaeta sp. DS3sAY3a]|nr:hypothetical protein IQ07DRAFT_585635 [Pyrenochaeta sp. DS3sAY3a]
MRYTAAVVLSTLAVGQAASIHNRHASFHERRRAGDVKRSADEVDWDKVAVDLKDVDWAAINWSSVFASPTPAPASSQAVEAKKVEPTPTPAPAAPTPTPAAEPTKKPETVTDIVSGFVTDLFSGVEAIASKAGAKIGKNDKSANGGIWVGSDSAWTAEFTNDANRDSVLYCWKANGFSGMSVNVNVPEISVGLKAGQKVQLSFAENVPAACAPVFADTALAIFGGWDQTWWEVTFGQYGAFDVSRNVNMLGNSIHSKGSKCTSDMNTCVFKCKDSSRKSCEQGADYDLFNCGAGTGGGGGFDTVMQGTGGGCSMGSAGEKVIVTYS